MKKLLVPLLALSLALGGCTVGKQAEDVDTQGKDPQIPAAYQIAIDAAEQKASYYQTLAKELEDEILSVRTELFASRVEYEARIDDLEDRLSDALAQKAPDDGGSTEGNGNAGNSGNAGNTETKPPQGSQSTPTPDKDPTEDFEFLIVDGRATLHAYVGKSTAVVIPSTYRGCTVVAIADRAFENQTRVQSVVLPSGVETVGWFAFSGCVALREVTIPESVRSISYGAFLNCNSAMVIRCAKDSYAERYAQSYGMETKH